MRSAHVRTRSCARSTQRFEGLQANWGCRYVDVSTCLEDEKGNLRADYTIEGMHLYAGAYRVVLDVLMPYLLEA